MEVKLKRGFSTLELLAGLVLTSAILLLSFPALKADLVLFQRFRDDERASLRIETAARILNGLYKESRSFAAVQSIRFISPPPAAAHPLPSTAFLGFLILDVTQLATIEEVRGRSQGSIEVRAKRKRQAKTEDYENWLAISVDGFAALKGTLRAEACVDCNNGEEMIGGRLASSPDALFYAAASPPPYPMLIVPVKASPVVYLDSHNTLRRIDPLLRVNQPLVYGLATFSETKVYDSGRFSVVEVTIGTEEPVRKKQILRIPISSGEASLPADIVS